MLTKLLPAFNEIHDEKLRELSLKAMDTAMRKGRWDEQNIRFCPVTLSWRNCDVSLVEHISDVVKICIANFDTLAKYYQRHGVPFSRDLVVAGALLHDIGKLTEFVYRDGQVAHSTNFQLMRHPLSGAIIAAESGLPDSIVHLIAVHSFEGDKSYQTPESTFVRSIDIFVFNCAVKGLERL